MKLLVSALAIALYTIGLSAAEVILEWNPSPAPDLAGYRLYYGVAPFTYTNVLSVGNTTSTTVGGLVRGVTYYFAATAVTASGAESIFSNEVSYTVPATEPVGSILLSGLAQTYDGQPKPVQAETTPTGLPVTITYDGLPTAPIAAGNYRVVASTVVSGTSVAVTNTLVISKATASVTVNLVNRAWTGTPIMADVSTSPAGLNVVVTYNGSPTPPCDPGVYTVMARVEDPNYSGAGEGQLRIKRLLPPGALRPIVATGG